VGEKTYDLLPRLVFFGNFPFLNNKKSPSASSATCGDYWRFVLTLPCFCSHFLRRFKQKTPANSLVSRGLFKNGAGEETRTLDIFLGKEVLYQLSYTRKLSGKK
jgi:hypothetical protein